ncbi:FecR family protein [Steroidobacter sp.]|uniref:FecR family protein n=1 Tax=Steroidobacter sp. TaxID=1978227 RepID=UPI001A4CA738|nr:FecR domain-containing protein [Steroidobacter sp.]MBL8271218.1 FecR domain-containing protein [Steroidobacter sp.]
MSVMDRAQSDADITGEACAWIAQLESGALTPEDLSAFREWVGRSPRHAAEIRRIAQLSEDVSLLAGMAEPLRDAIDSYRPLVAAERRQRRQWRWVAAAAVLVVSIAAILTTGVLTQDPQPTLLTTAVGDYRTVQLADGSEVKLSSNSQLEVNYTRDMRRLRLLKGEAYFSVAHDESAPFVVFAQEKYVRAVGTEFSVRMSGEDLDVLVTKGVVELNEAAAPSQSGAAASVPAVTEAPKPMQLRAGQGVTISLSQDLSPAAATSIVDHSERELQRTLAWREGLLDFSRTPLKDVVAEVGRHTALQIEIADPALGELKFDGIFRVGQVDQLLDALGATFDIKVERVDANHVRLSGK